MLIQKQYSKLVLREIWSMLAIKKQRSMKYKKVEETILDFHKKLQKYFKRILQIY